jgi:hypothetical protein
MERELNKPEKVILLVLKDKPIRKDVLKVIIFALSVDMKDLRDTLAQFNG